MVWNWAVLIAAWSILLVVALLSVIAVLWVLNWAFDETMRSLRLADDFIKFAREHREWKKFKKLKATKQALNEFYQRDFANSFFEKHKK